MQGPWIHEFVSIHIHAHPLDTIGNESCQTRQHVSSHHESNVSVNGPRRGMKLCVVQSAKVHVRAFSSGNPYQRCFIEWFTRWNLLMAQHWNWQQFAEVALLSCWMILFSCHWPRSCKIFFQPQWCQKFDVLPDFRYSWCTCELVIWEKFPMHCYLGDAVPHLLCANHNTMFKLT